MADKILTSVCFEQEKTTLKSPSGYIKARQRVWKKSDDKDQPIADIRAHIVLRTTKGRVDDAFGS